MDVKIYALKLSEDLTDVQFNTFLGCSQEERKEKIKRCKVSKKRDIMAVSQIFAKACIKKTFGIDIKKQEIRYGEFEKPYLFGYPDIHFNISHSEELLVCAVSDKNVGIDAEKIGEYSKKLIERVCSEEELERVLKSDNVNYEFCKLWTKKEAYSKLLGTGIQDFKMKDIEYRNVFTYDYGEYIISVAKEMG